MSPTSYSPNGPLSREELEAMIPIELQKEDLNRAIGLLQLNRNDVCLELDCGYAFLSVAMAEKCWIAVGITSHDRHVKTAKRVREIKDASNLIIAKSQPHEIPYPDEHFTKIVSRWDSHHWKSPEKVLRELRRVVARNGLLLIVDHVAHPDFEYSAFMDLIENMISHDHGKLISEDDLKQMLEKTGWKITVLEHVYDRHVLDDLLERKGKKDLKETIVKLLSNIDEELKEFIRLEEKDGKILISVKTVHALCEPI